MYSELISAINSNLINIKSNLVLLSLTGLNGKKYLYGTLSDNNLKI
jgi:hypothetical protein